MNRFQSICKGTISSAEHYNRSLFQNMDAPFDFIWEITPQTNTVIILHSILHPELKDHIYDYEQLLRLLAEEEVAAEDRGGFLKRMSPERLLRLREERSVPYHFEVGNGKTQTVYLTITPDFGEDGVLRHAYFSALSYRDEASINTEGILPEEEDAKLKKRKYPIVYLFIAAFLAVFLTFTISGFRGIRQELYREQSSNLLRVMEKISQNMDTMLSDKWDDVDFLARELSDADYGSHDSFLNKLVTLQNNMSEENGFVLAIDSSGICHTPEGSHFRWNNTTLLNQKERAVWVTNSPVVKEDVDSMLFTAKLPHPVSAGDATITHVVMVTDMRSLDKFLMIKDYGEESATYIIHATGGHVYRQNATNDLSNMYNVIAALEKCTFGYGTSIEQIKEDFANNQSGCAYVDYKGTPCYVVYERLSINDWYAVMMVPASLVGSNTTGFMRYIISFMTLFSLGVMTIIVSYLIINQKRRREQDEQIKTALKKTAVTMRKAAEAEKNANEAKTNFLSSMSHDIRTPMNAIIGMTTLSTSRSACGRLPFPAIIC